MTAERAAAERRAEARRRRLGLKLEEVEAELDPAALLIGEAIPGVPLDLGPEPMPARSAPRLATPDHAEAAPPALGPDGRPSFHDDPSYAAWLLDHPGEVDAEDAAYFRELLGSQIARRNLAVHGVDPERLRALVRQAA